MNIITFQEGDVDTSSQFSDDYVDDDMAPRQSDDGSELHEDAETIVMCHDLYGISV